MNTRQGETWNLSQVRLWIAYRDKALVQKYSSEPEHGMTAEILYGDLPEKAGDPPEKVNVHNSNAKLLGALRSGKIQATGLENGQGSRQTVRTQLWEDLTLTDYGGPKATPANNRQWGASGWTTLRFYVDDVRRLWRQGANVKKRKAAEQCSEWLKKQMKAEDGTPMPKQKRKDEYRREAIRKFGISRRSFEREWAYAIQETKCEWSKPGRPKKSSH